MAKRTRRERLTDWLWRIRGWDVRRTVRTIHPKNGVARTYETITRIKKKWLSNVLVRKMSRVKRWLFYRFEVDAVYYDPVVGKFIQVRGKHARSLTCSGYTEYYNDARTDISEQRLSVKRMCRCTKVGTLDGHSKLWRHDGIGWRVTSAGVD